MKYAAWGATVLIGGLLAVFVFVGLPSSKGASTGEGRLAQREKSIWHDSGAVETNGSESVARFDRSVRRVRDIARDIENADNLYAAVQSARRSGNGDAIRIAMNVVIECFNTVSTTGQFITKSQNPDFGVRQRQVLAADALRSQCSGFVGMSRQAKQDLLESMRLEVGGSETLLSRIEAISSKAGVSPLSDADRALLLEGLRSRDEVLTNRSLRAIAPMLSDMNTDPSKRPVFWYAAMLGEAIGDLDGVHPLAATTTLQINQACVSDLVCRFTDGEPKPTVVSSLTPEMIRIRRAYVDALSTNSWDAVVAVR